MILWLQNAHPSAIPSGALGLNRMGSPDIKPIDREIPAFGTYPVDVGDVLPNLNWPEQIELQAGKHVVRPRYEMVSATGRHRIAHVNVERDLTGDPAIPGLAAHLGKGYLLPAPVLPTDRFESVVLPTPMSTAQSSLPVALTPYELTDRSSKASDGRPRPIRRDVGGDSPVREANTSSRRAGGMELPTISPTVDMMLPTAGSRAVPVSGQGNRPWRRHELRRPCVQHRGDLQIGAAKLCGAATGLSTRLFLRMGPSRRHPLSSGLSGLDAMVSDIRNRSCADPRGRHRDRDGTCGNTLFGVSLLAGLGDIRG